MRKRCFRGCTWTYMTHFLYYYFRKARKGSIQLAPRTLPKCIGDYINAVRSHTFCFYECRTLVFSDGRFDSNLDSSERARKANPIGAQNVAKVHWRLYQCCKIAYLSFSASISVEPWFLAMVALTLIWTARKGPGKQIQLAPSTFPK